MIHYIYRIVNNKNNKSYIGYTINPKGRWSTHKYIARTGKGYLLHDAIRHDGIENFEFNILFESEDRTLTLTKMEKYYIEQFDSKANGYNSTIGGAGTLGWVPSAKTRELWSNQLSVS